MAENKCVCDHCKNRFSWDCDDGLAYPRGGCESFSLDWNALSEQQQEAIKRVLSRNEYDSPHDYDLDW